MKEKDRARLLLIVFSIIHIATVIGFVIRKDRFFAYNGVAVYIIYLLFVLYEKKRGILLENHIRAMIIVVIIAHSILGQYLDLYHRSKYFDSLLHITGTFSFSLFYFSIINKTLQPCYYSNLFVFIFIVSIGISAGTLFEIIEFLLDSIFNSNNQHGLVDTDLDMVMNVVGAVCAGGYVPFCKQK
ncbi:hypothetical protein [Petroclostridium sp. X23]|uniref:hypothetical protein n=1 Tax=Petroclostridium sp. X23 TaxID=3045146 RepID=UPI0024ACC858|nr:hypothetical protein [Petroclostridium sp. X23]WHH58525.1 hypothetical protein QKW49_22450 [Petroclostridium sp. X23]